MEKTSNYPLGRRAERRDVGYLPKGAVTEWLRASDSCNEVLELDSCGNIADDEIEPEYRTTHTFFSNTGATTNLEWAKAEVKQHNLKHPMSPWIIRHSHKMPEYICICKALIKDED